jgi:hypothetical protein
MKLAINGAWKSYTTRAITEEEVLAYMREQLRIKLQARAKLDAEIYLLEISIDYVEQKKVAAASTL